MWLPTLVAVGLHAGAGGWWLSRSGGAAGPATVHTTPITLVLLDPRPTADASPPPTRPVVSELSPVQRIPARPERTPDTGMRDKAAAPRELARPQADPAQPTSRVSGAPEPLEPAYLAGEPLINLGKDEASMNGSIALHLSIDDTGHVVDSQLSSQEGLPEAAVATLVRSFTGYVYVPARRSGRPVRSDVTIVISVRDGQGVSAQSP